MQYKTEINTRTEGRIHLPSLCLPSSRYRLNGDIMWVKNMMASLRPNIFQYHDHISFLTDWISYLKKTESRFSVRQLAQEAQIAVGYLSMVLARKRILSAKAFEKITPFLKLTAQEKKYLHLLRTVGESEEPQARLKAIQDMSKLSPFRKAQQKEVETYRYLTKWYYVAIREMVALKDFKPDPKWIQAKLSGNLSLKECQEALHFLEEKGFIKKTGDGRFILPENQLDCREGIFKASLGEFHRQMLELAYKSIDNTARDYRHLLGHTFAIDEEDVAELKKILDETLTKIEKLGSNSKTRTSLYQVELAAFPLTKKS